MKYYIPFKILSFQKLGMSHGLYRREESTVLAYNLITMCTKNMPDSTDFKTMLDNQTLPVEFAGKQPIDMKTYYNLFGVNRVPGEPKDSLIFNPNSKHIIVAHNKNVSFVIKLFCLLKSLLFPHDHSHTYEFLRLSAQQFLVFEVF